jgi:hypothetical protein
MEPYASSVALQAGEGLPDFYTPLSEFGVAMERSDAVRVWHVPSPAPSSPSGPSYQDDARLYGELAPLVASARGRPFTLEIGRSACAAPARPL